MKIHHLLLGFLVIICLSFGASVPAFAETTITGFKNVTIWVNPEYDRTSLLVMMEGKIVGATAPVQVRFLVPSTAEMFSAGSKDATGKYTGGPPDRKASAIPGWDEISYELKTDTFRVEYYDDSINGQPDKQIAYEFLRLYPISDLRVIVQQPRSATNFAVDPVGLPGKDSDGLSVSTYNYTNITAEQPIKFAITYTKSDPNPSLKSAPLSSQPGSPASSNSSADSAFLATTLVIVGILIVSMFVWVIRRQKPMRPARQAARQAAGQPSRPAATLRASAVRKNPIAGAGGKFCTQCGHAVEKQAKFCPYCGKQLGK